MEIVRQSQNCLTSQDPPLIERAAGDYGSAAVTAINIAIGRTAPAELLDSQARNAQRPCPGSEQSRRGCVRTGCVGEMSEPSQR